jgi:hypothetical protein
MWPPCRANISTSPAEIRSLPPEGGREPQGWFAETNNGNNSTGVDIRLTVPVSESSPPTGNLESVPATRPAV